MEVRNPMLIDEKKRIDKETLNRRRKKRSKWSYDILKIPGVKSEMIDSNNGINRNIFEEFKEKQRRKKEREEEENRLKSSEEGSGNTSTINTDTNETTITPEIEESDNDVMLKTL